MAAQFWRTVSLEGKTCYHLLKASILSSLILSLKEYGSSIKLPVTWGFQELYKPSWCIHRSSDFTGFVEGGGQVKRISTNISTLGSWVASVCKSENEHQAKIPPTHTHKVLLTVFSREGGRKINCMHFWHVCTWDLLFRTFWCQFQIKFLYGPCTFQGKCTLFLLLCSVTVIAQYIGQIQSFVHYVAKYVAATGRGKIPSQLFYFNTFSLYLCACGSLNGNGGSWNMNILLLQSLGSMFIIQPL